MEMRDLRALELAARAKIGFDGQYWLVPSQTTNARYKVTIGNKTSCQCEDFMIRGPIHACKHILAARLVCERDHGGKNPAPIAVDEVPKRLTYRQNWPLYDRAMLTEKDRFQELLFDLCRGVKTPERTGEKRGRPPIPYSDQVFAMTFMIYVGMSSRRFNCDLQAAHEKGHLSRPIKNARCVCYLLEDARLTPILENLIVQSSLPLRTIETTFSPDSTGFSTSRFVRWFDEKYGTEKSGRDWVKAHAICGVQTNIVTAVQIADRDAADSPQFAGLVRKTAENFAIKDVTADKGYLSNENLALVNSIGGTAFVPFKSNSTSGEPGSLWEKMYHFYSFNRDEFLKRYHSRSNIESTFSMVKAKFRDHVRSKTDIAMKNEVLCKFLAHNICVVHQSMIELGIDATFWEKEQEPHAKAILSFNSQECQ
jgi:transposase